MKREEQLAKLSMFDVKFLMEPQIRPYCGPLMFITSLHSAVGTIKASGCFGLVNTGKKHLLVTCYHVWNEFQKLSEKNSDLKLAVCLDGEPKPIVFAPEGPIGEDQSLDIATFDMKPLLAACGGQKFYSLNQNPTRPVAKGNRLFFIGYPGCLRFGTEEGVQFGRQPYAVYVTSVDGMLFHSDISSTPVWKTGVYLSTPMPDENGVPCGSRTLPARFCTPPLEPFSLRNPKLEVESGQSHISFTKLLLQSNNSKLCGGGLYRH